LQWRSGEEPLIWGEGGSPLFGQPGADLCSRLELENLGDQEEQRVGLNDILGSFEGDRDLAQPSNDPIAPRAGLSVACAGPSTVQRALQARCRVFSRHASILSTATLSLGAARRNSYEAHQIHGLGYPYTNTSFTGEVDPAGTLAVGLLADR
jgi:hypothetical protein